MQENLADNSSMLTLEKTPAGLDALNVAIERVGLGVLAERIGANYQLVQGWRSPTRRFAAPVEWCAVIEQATGVPRWELRPDVWWKVWPELIGHPGAPAAPVRVE